MTFAWWEGACEDETVFERYRAYLDTVLSSLPPDLQRLSTAFTLHDSELLELVVSHPACTANLNLLGFDLQERSTRYSLNYTGLQQLRLVSVGGEPLASPAGLGHLGYDEIELISPGEFEHRLLFSTGAEIVVRFSGFGLEHVSFHD